MSKTMEELRAERAAEEARGPGTGMEDVKATFYDAVAAVKETFGGDARDERTEANAHRIASAAKEVEHRAKLTALEAQMAAQEALGEPRQAHDDYTLAQKEEQIKKQEGAREGLAAIIADTTANIKEAFGIDSSPDRSAEGQHIRAAAASNITHDAKSTAYEAKGKLEETLGV